MGGFLLISLEEKVFVFAAVPGFGGSGVNSGTARIKFVEPDKRNKSQSELAREIAKKISKFNKSTNIIIQIISE